MGKFNEISQNVKQSFDGNNIEVNILQDKVVIDSEQKVIEINNTLLATNLTINGVPSECFTSAEKEKLNKINTPMQVVGRVDSVELLPTNGVVVGSVYLVGTEGSSDFEEYIAISSDPTTYESLGKTATPQSQSDWAETDETAASYILNRPAVRGGAGTNSIVEGDLTENTATGIYSHAEGYNTEGSGQTSHAEGQSTTASGSGSHAEGVATTASGNFSHAEGDITTASGSGSHAEGYKTTASGEYSHAECQSTKASGESSHAEGQSTTASGSGSHAEGIATTARGHFSHAEGAATTANNKSQHVFGENNIADPSPNQFYTRGNYVEIVGNGTDTAHRSNARTLDWNGNEVLAGGLTCGGNIIASGTNINEALGRTQGFSGVKFRVISGSLQVCIDGGGASWHTLTFAD